ncbi:MAG: DUF456 domain-containing protein [Anaerolineae bacterium]
MAQPFGFQLAILAMAVSLIVGLLPVIPTTPLILLVAVLYYFAVGWTWGAAAVILILAVLTIVSSTAELWLAPAGARKGGASWRTTALVTIASIVGFFVLPLIGAILLPIGLILVLEFLRVRDVRRATTAAGAWFVGWLLSNGLELVAGLAMIAIFWLHARP